MDIDTGMNYNHQDLAANVWTNPGEIAGNGVDDDHDGYVDDVHGIDTVNHDSNPIDDNGHGTHTAGTLAAVGNNALGVVGVNWNAKVLPCKFLNAGGSGSDAGAAECLNYAVTLKTLHGVNIRVTNNSWGGDRLGGDFSVLLNAFAAAGNAGIISFVAAGNGDANGVGLNIDIPGNEFDPASLSTRGAEHRGRRVVDDVGYPVELQQLRAEHRGARGARLGHPQHVLSGQRDVRDVVGHEHGDAARRRRGRAAVVDRSLAQRRPAQGADYQQRGRAAVVWRARDDGRAAQRVSAASAAAPPAQYTLTPAPLAVNTGSPLAISWTAPAGRPATDWIGLYRVGDPNTAYGWWAYTSGATSGTLNLTSPSQAGQYEFRYLLNNGYQDSARSAAVTVTQQQQERQLHPDAQSLVGARWRSPDDRLDRPDRPARDRLDWLVSRR